jgi:MFS family permease
VVDVPAPGARPPVAFVAPAGRFGVLRVPAYRVLWISSIFMFFGMAAQLVARAWLAVELTGTNAGIGGVFLAFGLPMLVLSPIGGVLADRFPKRTVLMMCQSTILAGALVVAVAVELDFLEYWMLLGSAVLHGAGLAVMGPTRMAYTGEVVDRPFLSNAVVLQQLSFNSTRVVGPAAAGALIGVDVIGAGGVYVLTSTLFVVAISITARLPRGNPRSHVVRKSPIGELVEGLRYIRSRPPILVLIAVSTVMTMVGLPFQAFLPSLADDTFDVGSSGYGLMSTVTAVGAVATSVWIAGRISRANVWRLQARYGLGFGIGVLLLALSPTYPVALGALVFLGGAAAGFQGANNSLVLTESELEFHGRVQSIMMTGFAAQGIMSLPLGLIADLVGLRETLTGMGIICTAAMVFYMRARRRHVAADNIAV